jgi:hypothetical protein
MVISRKRRNEAEENNNEGMLEAPFAQTFPEDKVEAKDDDPRIKEIESKFEERMRLMQERLEEVNRVNMQLMSQPVVQAEVDDIPKPQHVDLPDPVADPKAFAEAIRHNAIQDFEYDQRVKAKRSNKAQSEKDKAKELWDDFATEYPALAGDQKRVEFAANLVAEKLQRRGVDVARYMFINRDRFFEDVSKEYANNFGEVEVDEEGEAFDEDRGSQSGRERKPRRGRPRRERSEEVDRSVGMFGGQESGHRPAARSEEQQGDMISDMMDMQRKSGFF